jgi:hypothetical protein
MTSPIPKFYEVRPQIRAETHPPMKPFALPFRNSILRLCGFSLLASLLSPPLFGAGITEFSLAENRVVKGDVTKGRLPKSGPKKPETRLNIFRPSADSSVGLQGDSCSCSRTQMSRHQSGATKSISWEIGFPFSPQKPHRWSTSTIPVNHGI